MAMPAGSAAALSRRTNGVSSLLTVCSAAPIISARQPGSDGSAEVQAATNRSAPFSAVSRPTYSITRVRRGGDGYVGGIERARRSRQSLDVDAGRHHGRRARRGIDVLQIAVAEPFRDRHDTGQPAETPRAAGWRARLAVRLGLIVQHQDDRDRGEKSLQPLGDRGSACTSIIAGCSIAHGVQQPKQITRPERPRHEQRRLHEPEAHIEKDRTGLLPPKHDRAIAGGRPARAGERSTRSRARDGGQTLHAAAGRRRLYEGRLTYAAAYTARQVAAPPGGRVPCRRATGSRACGLPATGRKR